MVALLAIRSTSFCTAVVLPREAAARSIKQIDPEAAKKVGVAGSCCCPVALAVATMSGQGFAADFSVSRSRAAARHGPSYRRMVGGSWSYLGGVTVMALSAMRTIVYSMTDLSGSSALAGLIFFKS
jgi:hypothetical protein